MSQLVFDCFDYSDGDPNTAVTTYQFASTDDEEESALDSYSYTFEEVHVSAEASWKVKYIGSTPSRLP